ncbi:hypothetical protein K470DRAFT_301377 [Piedraia hortae CBS 480.64]|uniref:Ribosomal RNA-processing protein 17 n=1 Tax=Piedraia hortae CBS 480.64 TaxID=1314780 RepID=A0A6A7BRE7_9PEZI|nr:hypothetical protein K470DRAFT_301377 [Piedraia hortae CBS 480.64]
MKRKHVEEELVFDPKAREEYLTGFHARKQARIRKAKELAVQRAKEQRVLDRRRLREQRNEELKSHLAQAESEKDDKDKEWNGLDDDEPREDEYVDEENYTTVTVEPISLRDDDDEEGEKDRSEKVPLEGSPGTEKQTTTSTRKRKKRNFAYESKAERQKTHSAQKKKSRAAKARRANRVKKGN